MMKKYLIIMLLVVATGALLGTAYGSYSLEDNPNTGGYPYDWLIGEKDRIAETCVNAKADSVILRYCQYL